MDVILGLGVVFRTIFEWKGHTGEHRWVSPSILPIAPPHKSASSRVSIAGPVMPGNYAVFHNRDLAARLIICEALLGHARSQITADVYTRAVPSVVRSAQDRLVDNGHRVPNADQGKKSAYWPRIDPIKE